MEALKRQQRLAHGLARRQNARVHALLKLTATGIGRFRQIFIATTPAALTKPAVGAAGAAKPPSRADAFFEPVGAAAGGENVPNFASLMLLSLITHGRLPDDHRGANNWGSCPRVQMFGLQEAHHLNEALLKLKLAVTNGSYDSFATAPPALMMCVLSDWFGSFTTESICETSLAVLVDESDRLLQLASEVADVARVVGGAGEPVAIPEETPEEEAARAQAYMVNVRAVCCALQAHEQELFLIVGAILRHVLNCVNEDPHIPTPTPEELARVRSSSGGGAASSVDGSGATPHHRGHSHSLFGSAAGGPGSSAAAGGGGGGAGGIARAGSLGMNFHLPRFGSGAGLHTRNASSPGGVTPMSPGFHHTRNASYAGPAGASAAGGAGHSDGAVFAATVAAAAAAAFPPSAVLGGSLAAICRWNGTGTGSTTGSGLGSVRRSTPAGQMQQQNAAAATAKQLAPEVALRALCR
jgi:hypothetical protein